MNKMVQAFLCSLLLIVTSYNSSAQLSNRGPVRVAVFVPMYINNAFNGSTYKLSKLSLPKNILPGLEFYNGVMMAIDSLRQEGISAEISIYDTKDLPEFTRVVSGTALNNTGVIIAALTNTTELTLLANVAKQKKIPLISATYPNTGGVSANPYFVLLNSSLLAHVEGIYKYLLKNHSLDNIIMVKRNGSVESYLKSVLNDLNRTSKTTPLQFNWVELTDTFYNYQLTRSIDTLRRNVVVVSSPEEKFGVKVVQGINALDNLTTTVIGMPTWDGVSAFNRSSLDNVEIIYSTPFNYSRYNHLGSSISSSYRSTYGSRPSDMVYRGYETMFHFTKLLNKHHDDLINKLSDTDHTLFNHFDIQPVKLKKDNSNPDYQENKRLYFIKKQQGTVMSVSNL